MASETEIPKETHHDYKAWMHRFAEGASGCRQQEIPRFEPSTKYQYENLGTKTFSMICVCRKVSQNWHCFVQIELGVFLESLPVWIFSWSYKPINHE